MITRHGLRQLSYMKELGMGNDRYVLIDIDNGEKENTPAEAVKDVDHEWKPDRYNTFWGRNKQRYANTAKSTGRLTGAFCFFRTSTVLIHPLRTAPAEALLVPGRSENADGTPWEKCLSAF